MGNGSLGTIAVIFGLATSLIGAVGATVAAVSTAIAQSVQICLQRSQFKYKKNTEERQYIRQHTNYLLTYLAKFKHTEPKDVARVLSPETRENELDDDMVSRLLEQGFSELEARV
jgi:hypothetical protein